MNVKEFIKNNTKFILFMIIVIVLGITGMSYALTIGNFKPIEVNVTASNIEATIDYEDGSDGNIISSGLLLPISDSLVTLNPIDNRVLKISFNVTGSDKNPENAIYDIALHNINMNCELKTDDVKWRLYRGETKISEGSFSLSFDAMVNDRMVLTEVQEDLTTNTTTYTLLIWISESCTDNISACDPALAQNKYLNKAFNASVKVEVSTKSKKELVRTVSDEEACSYEYISVPVCKTDIIYNGASQALIDENDKYTLLNKTGINAGYYTVVAKLSNGYIWSDDTSDDKPIICEINKKSVTITTLNQTITYGDSISNATDKVSISGLISVHTLNTISLYTDIAYVGTGTISGSNAKIVDASGNDVTSNYNITYNNIGVITINEVSNTE